MNHPHLLFFSRDPGATNQLVAVHDLLCKNTDKDCEVINRLIELMNIDPASDVRISVLAKMFAKDIWQTTNKSFQDWDEMVFNTISDEDKSEAICNFLAQNAITGVVTGTDDIDELDTKRLWKSAKTIGLPVCVILDNNINLEDRFIDSDGDLCIPDLVFVLDKESRAHFISEGIPHKQICVTENLHHLRLKLLNSVNAKQHPSLRGVWGVSSEARVVLFASENTTEMAAFGRMPNWDECACLRQLIADIGHGKPLGGLDLNKYPISIVVRPHPRDRAGKYDEFVREGAPSVIVSKAGTSSEAIWSADLVVGKNSALLDEALLFEKPICRF